MGDKPIIFSAPMIRALLDDRKHQTRRVLKPQPLADMSLIGIYAPKLTAVFGYETPDSDLKVRLRFMPRDRVWVKEKYAIVPSTAYRMSEGVNQTVNPSDSDMAAVYAAGWERSKPSWKSPMFMPKWASRITLIITDVRVQRLQDISEDDAIAEGCSRDDPINPCRNPGVKGFYHTWQSINSKRGFDWSSNPWVAAYSFQVVKTNIDMLEAA